MAKTRPHVYKHVKGVQDVLNKLQKIEKSIKVRSLELLFYLTASVHFDFISRIVLGEVEDMFELAPNSICYLLDYKWEKVHHDKLFMLTGGYVKSIQVLNIVEATKSDKSLTTLIIGIDDSKYSSIAELLERGGGIMSVGSGGAKAYTMPERPLWGRYRRHMSGYLQSGNWDELKTSKWQHKFKRALQYFAANVKSDSLVKGDIKLDVQQIALTEQAFMENYINQNDPKDTMSMSDLKGIAEHQREVRDFSDATWERIMQKFKNYGDASLDRYAENELDELEEKVNYKPQDSADYKPQDIDEDIEDDIRDVLPY